MNAQPAGSPLSAPSSPPKGEALQTVPYSHRRPIDVGVDLTNAPAAIPLCAVTPGGGQFAAARLTVGQRPDSLRAWFRGREDEPPLVESQIVAAGTGEVLYVPRDDVVALLLARCGTREPDPRKVVLAVPVERRVGEGGTRAEGCLTVRLTAVRTPSLPRVTPVGASVRLEDGTEATPAAIATMGLAFGSDVALAPNGFRLPLRLSIDGIAPSALKIRSIAGSSLVAVSPAPFSGPGEAAAILEILDPPGLAREGMTRLVVEADPAALVAAATASGGAGRSFDVAVAIGDPAIGDGSAVAGATATVEVEAKPFVRIDAGGASRRVLLGDAAPAELAPVTGDLHVDEIRGVMEAFDETLATVTREVKLFNEKCAALDKGTHLEDRYDKDFAMFKSAFLQQYGSTGGAK